MSFNDRDALLAAITADPDDDTPRLVYADWLTEHGEDDRAEFIRLQCALEHATHDSAERSRLATREDALRTTLFGHLEALGFAEATFRRGFVDRVTSGLLALSANLNRLEPADAPAYELMVRWDEYEGRQYDDYDLKINTTSEVFAEPALRRCVSLDLPCMGLWPSSYLCESEHLVNLRRFNFPNNEAGDHIESVASSVFANLRWANFNYSNSAAGRPSIIPLAECPHLANLEYLDFGCNALWDIDAKAVAVAVPWNRLRVLDLSGASFSVGAVAELFATPHLPALAELNLGYSFDSGNAPNADEHVSGIAGSPLFARLSKLGLDNNGITDTGAKALAAAPGEVRLTRLDLTGNPMSPDGRRALVERFGEGVCVFEGDDQ